MRIHFLAMMASLAVAALSSATPAGAEPSAPKPDDDVEKFAASVLDSLEREWSAVFSKDNRTYRKPGLVLYEGGAQDKPLCWTPSRRPSEPGKVETPQQIGAAPFGPFYCAESEKIYLDPAFLRAVEKLFPDCGTGSACRFAQAHVIAHLAGHHVQNQLGILPKVKQVQAGMDTAAAGQLQVKVELQADCFAGIWAKHENERLKRGGKPPVVELGDIDSALGAVSAAGDDNLRHKNARIPDSFTHGSAEQRQHWFNAGYREGAVPACNTFRTTGSGTQQK
jgi:predicted metalloprotease